MNMTKWEEYSVLTSIMNKHCIFTMILEEKSQRKAIQVSKAIIMRAFLKM